ncbi:GPW/gp25 family protein [Pseudomonas citronellolis]|uniref:GPW/gp25 family protein n=1 Tax=Pseudomonas citronellolis TaxID=53408 RepID=UPI0023E39A14|nr:GPW/gp25 family protein [Pseudomonas citronellolis]MDF3935352.1 GPW/gp25 family protein [Pseudomonas citronellolis]
MNRTTGSSIGTLDHIRQSVADILTTRIGTRCMRREYGSQLPELVDQPFNDATRLRVYAATVMALMRWEPRIRVSRVQFTGVTLQGGVVLQLDATLVDNNEQQNISIPLSLGAA